MKQLLHRFSLQSAKFNTEVFLCVAVIWLIILGCAISSILGQPFTRRQRNFWLAVVILVPVIGLLAYLPFSFKREDLAHIFPFRGAKDKDGRKRPGGNSSPRS